jgi:HNH endonuclease
MRPILANKGGNGTYPYVGQNNTGGNATFNFNSIYIEEKFTTYTPLVGACLNMNVVIAKVGAGQMAQPAPADWDLIKNCKPLIATHISDGDTSSPGYGSAAVPLVQGIGAFCSYCESPLKGNIDVEHVMPKTPFPAGSVAWENLLLACTMCNSIKGDDPSRDWVVTNLLNNIEPTNESGYYAAIRGYAVWPDNNQAAYAAMKPLIKAANLNQPGQWSPVSFPFRTGQSVASVNYTTKVVTASMYAANGTTLTQASVAVMLPAITVQTHTGQVLATQAQAQKIIYECSLNQTQPTSIYDRRVINRTVAWFQALNALATLNSVVNSAPVFDRVWSMTLALAANVGFFSVWMNVLYSSNAVDPNNQGLATRFVNEACGAAGVFPNTDTTYLLN